MQRIRRDDLKSMVERGEDFALVEVLPPAEFRRAHLPNAINVPLGDDYAARIQQEIPDKDRPVVVYCANLECDASPTAARVLDELGYREVYDYAAGKADWLDAGLPFETSSPTSTAASASRQR